MILTCAGEGYDRTGCYCQDNWEKKIVLELLMKYSDSIDEEYGEQHNHIVANVLLKQLVNKIETNEFYIHKEDIN